jgi:predicted outer membrane protein
MTTRRNIKKLNELTGNDFDKEYMDAMVTNHRKALDAFSKEVDSTDNSKFKSAVVKVRPLSRHIQPWRTTSRASCKLMYVQSSTVLHDGERGFNSLSEQIVRVLA